MGKHVMTEERQTLLMIKGTIADLPETDQQKIREATQKVRAVLSAYSEGHADLAMALLSAELVVKASA